MSATNLLDLCNYILSEEKGAISICNEDAPYDVTVKTKQVHAIVPLCQKHKAVHDEAGARLRTSKK